MRIKRIITMCLAFCGLFALTGCQLAKENAGLANNGNRLIGVFVTKEYLDLFDMEGYLNDNINKLADGGENILDGNISKYQGRLYAILKTRVLTEKYTGNTTNTKEFVFDSVDGIAYFAATVPATEHEENFITSGSDEGISDGHSSYIYGDEEESITLEGTIYGAIGRAENTFYINPVFQSADGSVYATAGSGYMMNGVEGEGAVYSTTLDETTTITEKGKTKSKSFSIKISLTMMYAPEKITIIQMNQDSNIVLQNEYTPGEVPESLTMEMDTAYLIVETYKRDYNGNLFVTRSLTDRSEEAIETYYRRDDGICVKEWTQVNWNNSNLNK